MEQYERTNWRTNKRDKAREIKEVEEKNKKIRTEDKANQKHLQWDLVITSMFQVTPSYGLKTVEDKNHDHVTVRFRHSG